MIVVLAFGLAGIGCQPAAEQEQEQETEAVTEEVEDVVELVDPVCGATVTAETEFTTELEGVAYYFCCDDCLQQFVADPAKYLMTEVEPVVEPEAETDG